ncbi:GIY-YIG nuclease family protein [Oceanimonas sp. CHS3-5]|uniref:GIY-YIG nuclease family protein n=1 Tax=Oceanimonas sp. CHS3-5 TaxID=3068186 RepID=UPI00273E6E08|nr:GIY-YIG nuclease family protein [Oceanimonas sp. CHS3-5]MDP5293776.1 GIY-YIG nuclease family protein [Oceanimonas sp. CHS3-5]
MSQWHLYLLRCRDDSLYGGITLEPERRCREHNELKARASRYVWSRRPAVLVWQQAVGDKSTALKLEYRLKRLPRKQKEQLLSRPESWRQWLLKNEDPANAGPLVMTD